jgi:uncharacterized membrane protein
MSTARDINDNGQIVGTSPVPNAVPPRWDAVLWEAGTMTRLPQPHPDANSAALAINNRGQAVGLSVRYPATSGPAILWDRGIAIELPSPQDPGEPGYAIATAINERGQVVGFVDNPAWRTLPLIWEDGVVTQLPFDSGNTEGVRAVGINNRGDIVGTSIDYGAEVGIIWTR